MKKRGRSSVDRDYLRRCKQSSTQAKFEWLAAALDFAYQTNKKRFKR